MNLGLTIKNAVFKYAYAPLSYQYHLRQSPKQIDAYMRQHAVKKLHLGCGRNLLEGWLNTDYNPRRASGITVMDVTQPFPFDSQSFDYIFTEHMIEHLSYENAQFMLRESYRILKPGGKIRVATPDLRAMLQLLQAEVSESGTAYKEWVSHKHIPHYLPTVGAKQPGHVINNMFYNPIWQHRFIFDRQTLESILLDAEFSNVTSCEMQASDDEALANLESHGVQQGEINLTQFETLIVEATR